MAHVLAGVHMLDAPDYLAVELMRWFKHSFFKWVSAPLVNAAQCIPSSSIQVGECSAGKRSTVHSFFKWVSAPLVNAAQCECECKEPILLHHKVGAHALNMGS